jgi:hypothetical protein
MTLCFFKSCPGMGDDVVHSPLPFFHAAPFLTSKLLNDEVPIDVAFADFIANDILIILDEINQKSIPIHL